MSHNGSGQMGVDFLDFVAILADYQSNFVNSESVSNDFAYFPIIFVNGHAFFGFNQALVGKLFRSLALNGGF